MRASSVLNMCLCCLLAGMVGGIPQVSVTEDLQITSKGKDLLKIHLTENIRFTTLSGERTVDETVTADDVAVRTVITEVSTQEVLVSPQCAAIVMVISGALGAAVAVFLIPTMLWIAGFSAIGVESGTFAADWQSTMPLVAKGSLFASLQSIAMGGVGAITLVSAAAFGGAAGAGLISAICKGVDNAKPGVEQDVVNRVYSAVKNSGEIFSNATKSAEEVARALEASGWGDKLIGDVESISKDLFPPEWREKVSDTLKSWEDYILHIFSAGQRSSIPTSLFLVAATACLLRATV